MRRNRKILLIVLLIFVLLVVAFVAFRQIQDRLIQDKIYQQFNDLAIGPANEIYSATFNHKPEKASALVFNYTYYYWEAARFYNFSNQTVANGVSELLAVIYKNDYKLFGFQGSDTQTQILLTPQRGTINNSLEFISNDKRVNLNLYCFNANNSTSPFGQDNSSGYVSQKIFSGIKNSLGSNDNGTVCGYVISNLSDSY